jgi:hypothetical protein
MTIADLPSIPCLSLYFGKLQMTTRTVIVPSLTTMLRDDDDFLHGLVAAVCVI